MSGYGVTWGRAAGAVSHARVLLVALVVVTQTLVMPLPTAAAAEQGLVEVGALRSTMMDRTRFLEADVSARRLLDIGQPNTGTGMRVAFYDLDTLAPVGAVDIPGASSVFAGQRAAVDELHHRLFLLYGLPPGGLGALRPADSLEISVSFGIAVIDTVRMRLIGTRPLLDLVISPTDSSVVGNGPTGVKAMSYYAPEDKLYVVTEESSSHTSAAYVNERLVFVHEFDASNMFDGAAAGRNWTYPVPQCPSVMGTYEQSVVLRTASPAAVFVPCRVVDPTRSLIGVGVPFQAGGIARVNLVPVQSPLDLNRFSVDFFPVSGDLSLGPVALDPATRRIILRADAADITESGLLVFDAPSASLLGKIQVPPTTDIGVVGMGIDQASGRVYAIAPGEQSGKTFEASAVVASARGVTVDQGQLTRLSLHGDARRDERPRITVDPIRRRLYWEVQGDDYAVIEDRIPPRSIADPPDPDANTIDVPEGIGSAANVFGGARAYGTRIRWVNGISGVDRNVQKPVNQLDELTAPYLGQGTREIHFSRVSSATLSNDEATARALGAEHDQDNTGADLSRIGDLGAGDQFASNVWPYPEASCLDFSRQPTSQSTKGAAVACDLGNHTVSGQTSYTPSSHASLPETSEGSPVTIMVGRSFANVSSIRDPIRGIVSVAEAEARHIDLAIPGVQAGAFVRIGRLYSRAETSAHGRPGTAGSSYERIIEDVVVGAPDGSVRRVCTEPCSVAAVRDAVNRTLGIHVRIEFPDPDAVRARGTPGGYEALIVRDPFQQANDRVVNEQGDIRLEVPGMELTVFADGRVASRVVASFAGVSVESHYGIFRLSRGLPPRLLPPTFGLPPFSLSPIGPPSLPPAIGPIGPGMGELVRKTIRGFKFFVASPGHAARVFAFWAFLAAPLLLLRRRRALGRRAP